LSVDDINHWLRTFIGGGYWRQVVPLGIAGVLVWALWFYRFISSRLYKPVINDFRLTTSVIVPSYREDPQILLRCLESWLSQDPGEVIVVVDVDDTECLERLAEVGDPRLQVIKFKHQGKRSALGVGIRRARNEILVFADSDTSWQPGLLDAVQMPFIDPRVGGVGTQQNVYQRETSIWRRIADWLVNLRYYDYVPAMSRKGGVICLSGRTAAYRRSVILPVVRHLEDEFFLGRRCISGDDGRMTWLTISSGYKTVHQSNARAISMFPDSFAAFVRQRVRWSRNSYRCYITALWKGWLWRTSMISRFTVLQILVTPLTMGLTLGYLVLVRLNGTPSSYIFAAIWLLGGRGIRAISHLRRHPAEILLLPLTALVVIMISLPIKLYAFVTMNKQGWLTRTTDSVGGQGQSAESLREPAV
jgi:cellulose synthase/poly-beta-1,6-N-acetylglucosamine synthase-like glycosyltransferase